MKSALVIAAALALGGSAFAGVSAHGVIDTVKKDAHQIGSSFRQDFHRMARGDKFRQEQAAAQGHAQPHTASMGAAPADNSVSSSGRQARMDAAYANWQRTHR